MTTSELISVNSSLMWEGSGNGGESESFPRPLFILCFLFLLALMALAMNSIILVLLARSWRRCTSLNINLLSLTLLNLLTALNQVALAVSIIKGVWALGRETCHIVAFIQFFYGWTTTFIHLLLSRDRYQVCRDPLTWQKNRRKAFHFSVITWAVVGTLGILDRVLHHSDLGCGAISDYTVCYWAPTTLDHANMSFRFTIQLLALLGFLCLSVSIYYTYFRVYKEIRANERMKEQEAKMASVLLTQNKRKKTTSERALIALVTIFSLHTVSLLPSYIANVVRHAEGMSKPNHSELIHPVGLLVLTCIGYITTVSSCVLLFNYRFKQHMKAVLQCYWDPEECDKLADSLVNTTSIPSRVQSAPKQHPSDITVFISKGSRTHAYELHPSQRTSAWSTNPCNSFGYSD